MMRATARLAKAAVTALLALAGTSLISATFDR
jgi:hypothetical protein